MTSSNKKPDSARPLLQDIGMFLFLVRSNRAPERPPSKRSHSLAGCVCSWLRPVAQRTGWRGRAALSLKGKAKRVIFYRHSCVVANQYPSLHSSSL